MVARHRHAVVRALLLVALSCLCAATSSAEQRRSPTLSAVVRLDDDGGDMAEVSKSVVAADEPQASTPAPTVAEQQQQEEEEEEQRRQPRPAYEPTSGYIRAASGALRAISVMTAVSFVASDGNPLAPLLDAQSMGVLSRADCVDDETHYVLAGAYAVAVPLAAIGLDIPFTVAAGAQLLVGVVVCGVMYGRAYKTVFPHGFVYGRDDGDDLVVDPLGAGGPHPGGSVGDAEHDEGGGGVGLLHVPTRRRHDDGEVDDDERPSSRHSSDGSTTAPPPPGAAVGGPSNLISKRDLAKKLRWIDRRVLNQAFAPHLPAAWGVCSLACLAYTAAWLVAAPDRTGPETLFFVVCAAVVFGTLVFFALSQRVAAADTSALFRSGFSYVRLWAELEDIPYDEAKRILSDFDAYELPTDDSLWELMRPFRPSSSGGLSWSGFWVAVLPRGVWYPASYTTAFGSVNGWNAPDNRTMSPIALWNLLRVALAAAFTAYPAQSAMACAIQHGSIAVLHLLTALGFYLALDMVRTPQRRPMLVLSALSTGCAAIAMGHPIFSGLIPPTVAFACFAWLVLCLQDVCYFLLERVYLGPLEHSLRLATKELDRRRMKLRPRSAELRALTEATLAKERERKEAERRALLGAWADDDDDDADADDRQRSSNPLALVAQRKAAAAAAGGPTSEFALSSGSEAAPFREPLTREAFRNSSSSSASSSQRPPSCTASTDDDDDDDGGGGSDAWSYDSDGFEIPRRQPPRRSSPDPRRRRTSPRSTSAKPPGPLRPQYVPAAPPAHVVELVAPTAARHEAEVRARSLPGIGDDGGSDKRESSPRPATWAVRVKPGPPRRHGKLPAAEDDWRNHL